MEVCGTHTMAIARSGIKKLLPEWLELVSGPGCPVCVTPEREIDKTIEISKKKNVIMTTFGDMMRVPGSRENLEGAKRKGSDIRIVYSVLDALRIAEENPEKKVVFMGIGFETTSPTFAAAIKEAKKRKINNFFILSNFKLIFPALEALSKDKDIRIDGFICPGHVSVITGSVPYERIAKTYKKPCVITGFEPGDILKGVERLTRLIKDKKYGVEIEYTRAVGKNGNPRARKLLEEVFAPRGAEWRGLGVIKKSGLKLRGGYRDFDAEGVFNVKEKKALRKKPCICGEILKGLKTPADCVSFGKACTPQRPIGPCMVSSEGACAAAYKYNEAMTYAPERGRKS